MMPQPVPTDIAIALALSLGVSLALGLAAFVVGRLLAPSRPTAVKVSRYEAGNIPLGRARGRLSIQYFGYLLIFVTFEPIVVMLLTLVAVKLPLHVTLLLLLAPALYLVGLQAVIDKVRRVELWTLER